MKHLQGIHFIVCLAISEMSLAAEKPDTATTAVAFQVHDGYFVSNQFEPDAATSFVVLKDQAAFDQVFGIARVMRDKSLRLAAACGARCGHAAPRAVSVLLALRAQYNQFISSRAVVWLGKTSSPLGVLLCRRAAVCSAAAPA
jgi:hypothetical protein